MMKPKKSYEGLQNTIRQLKTPKIETWRNQYSDREYSIFLSSPEFTCICPKTGLPDFAVIHLDYKPHRSCLELKSFKLYLISFRNIGIFHEHLVNRLMEDIIKACDPHWARLEVVMNLRGGIGTTVNAEYTRKKKRGK